MQGEGTLNLYFLVSPVMSFALLESYLSPGSCLSLEIFVFIVVVVVVTVIVVGAVFDVVIIFDSCYLLLPLLCRVRGKRG